MIVTEKSVTESRNLCKNWIRFHHEIAGISNERKIMKKQSNLSELLVLVISFRPTENVPLTGYDVSYSMTLIIFDSRSKIGNKYRLEEKLPPPPFYPFCWDGFCASFPCGQAHNLII